MRRSKYLFTVLAATAAFTATTITAFGATVTPGSTPYCTNYEQHESHGTCDGTGQHDQNGHNGNHGNGHRGGSGRHHS